MKIKIWKTDEEEGGYLFDIWLDEEADDGVESDDTGFCSGSYEEAIEMACEQAKDLLSVEEGAE